MIKKQKLLKLLSLLIFPINFSSCSNGNIKNYTGVYKIIEGYTKTCNYYWGQTTEIGNEPFSGVGAFVTITEDSMVDYKYLSDPSIRGTVNCYKDYVKFNNLPFDSNYQFKLSVNNNKRTLAYYNKSQNAGFVYDFTVTYIVLEEWSDPYAIENMKGDYIIKTSTHTQTRYGADGSSTKTVNETNYKSIKACKFTIKEDYTYTLTGVNKIENGTFTINKSTMSLTYKDGDKILDVITQLNIQETTNGKWLSGSFKTTPSTPLPYYVDEYQLTMLKLDN